MFAILKCDNEPACRYYRLFSLPSSSSKFSPFRGRSAWPATSAKRFMRLSTDLSSTYINSTVSHSLTTICVQAIAFSARWHGLGTAVKDDPVLGGELERPLHVSEETQLSTVMA